MATLQEFAALQLERNAGSRSMFEEDIPTDLRPASIFWSSGAKPSGDTYAAKLLIVGAFGVGAKTLEALFEDASLEHIGMIVLPELTLRGCAGRDGNQSGICAVWRSTHDHGILLVNVSHKISPNRAHAFALAIVSAVNAQRTLILDQVSAKEFGYTSEEVTQAVVRALVTDAEAKFADSALASKGEAFPSGAIMSGVSAALLSMCQTRSRPAALCVCLAPDVGGSHVTECVTCLSRRVRQALAHVTATSGATSVSGVRQEADVARYVRESVKGAEGNPLYV